MALTHLLFSFRSRFRKTRVPRYIAPSRWEDRIDVYRETEKPQGAFKEIALLTANGHPFEHLEIETRFIKRARELGADAVLFLPAVKKIEAPSGWRIFDTFRYLAAVIIYER
jgi:hypothetical protein